MEEEINEQRVCRNYGARCVDTARGIQIRIPFYCERVRCHRLIESAKRGGWRDTLFKREKNVSLAPTFFASYPSHKMISRQTNHMNLSCFVLRDTAVISGCTLCCRHRRDFSVTTQGSPEITSLGPGSDFFFI
jgi:hypothetical protein